MQQSAPHDFLAQDVTPAGFVPNRKTILYINTSGFVGGSEISLMTLMGHLHRGCYEPVLVTMRDSQLTEQTQARAITAYEQDFSWYSRRRPWQYWSSVFNLHRVCRRHQAALIHTNCDFSLRFVHSLANIARIPYVSHIRDFVRAWFDEPQLSALHAASHIICNSSAVADSCIAAGLDAQKLSVLYNPVDIDAFATVGQDELSALREEFEIDGNVPVIGIVGQIQPIKGLQTYIDAAVKLAAQGCNPLFLVIGSAPDAACERFASHLKQQVRDSGYQSRFRFVGQRRDIPAIMHLLDVLVVPSWNEPFGRVVVEGMAAGTAVIATDSGGIPEIVDQRQTGLLVPPKNASALADAMQELLQDDALRKRLACAGKAAAGRFSIQQHVQKMEKLYQDLLAERA